MPRPKTPPAEKHLARLRADLTKIKDPEQATALLDAMAEGIQQLRQARLAQDGPPRHRAAIGERLEAWIEGELELGKLPKLTEAQAQALRDLFAQTQILSVDVQEPEPDLHWVDIAFQIGGWQASSNRQ